MKKLLAFVLMTMMLFSCSAWANDDSVKEKVYFSTTDSLEKIVLAEIGRAEKNINVAMYFFTSSPLAKDLITAKKRNVEIKVLLDEGQKYNKYSRWDLLVEEGIKVKFYRSKGLMHNKFCIIDEKTSLTGSYNWTYSATTKNEENLTVTDSESIAKKFNDEFQKLWTGPEVIPDVSPDKAECVGNRNSKVFHRLNCGHVKRMRERNKVYFLSREEAVKAGFRACKFCGD